MYRLNRKITCKGFVLGEIGDECFVIESVDTELSKIKILKNEEVVITNISTIDLI